MKKIVPSIDFIASGNAITLVELLRGRELHQPERLAFRFLINGEEEQVDLTYKELGRKAGIIGTRLKRLGLAGQRAVLVYPPGLECITAFLGCMYAGVIAVPAYSPPATARLKNSSGRVLAIIRDAEPAIGLTASKSLAVVEELFANGRDGRTLSWLASDLIEGEAEEDWPDPAVTQDSIAFLQYTSGSTATPKGVMVTHGNLLHNLRMINDAFRQDENCVIVGWLPIYHDLGLIGDVLQTLYLGATCILMSPMHFLQRPVSWLQAISKYRATMSGAPDFAYDLCVRKVTPEQRATLDLSCWAVAPNGAEPVRASTLERFASEFEPCGFRRNAFYPCYGLAEATLMVTGSHGQSLPFVRTFQGIALRRGEIAEDSAAYEPSRSLVSCGGIPQGEEIAIVDPETARRLPPNRVGEIWVSGPNVAQGYWNRPEESEQTFRAQLEESKGRSFLRTGDLGFLHRGELFITGRINDLIIIRGRNYYPQDIELTAQNSHPSLRSGRGAAFSLEVSNEERLVVVQEANARRPEADLVLDVIRRDVASEHEVQPFAVVLIRSGSIPKTSSGKIQRRACRDAFLSSNLHMIAEWRETSVQSNGDGWRHEEHRTREFVMAAEPHERQRLLDHLLHRELANILGVLESQVDIQQPLVNLGIDSVRSFELKNRIERSFGVAIPMAKLLEGASIAQITALVLNHLVADRTAALEPAIGADAGNVDGLQNPEHLLTQLDALSDQEVEALLKRTSLAKGSQ